ncbi:MAG TPA: hypothetical protein DDW42_01735 [Desulfobacteraceae bacterium]|nr:hypothetical protein [Desulfobacteraceae bacterium]
MKKQLQLVIAGAIAIFAIVGGWVQLDAHWTPRSYHEQCFADMRAEIQTIQQTSLIQQAYSEIFYYSKMEIELTKASLNHPDDQGLKDQLNDMIKKRKEAETRLEDLKGK